MGGAKNPADNLRSIARPPWRHPMARRRVRVAMVLEDYPQPELDFAFGESRREAKRSTGPGH
jgi:hypothetical protein